MPTPAYTIICKQKKLIAPGIFELVFSKPENFVYKAGQFVMFEVPLIENPDDIQKRAYSIASTPGEPDLLFVIKLLKGGRASRWVEQALAEGMEVKMQGPLGVCTLEPDAARQYLFVATGSGIAPFRSHITRILKDLHPAPKMTLVFGVLHPADLFWTGYFGELAVKHPEFQFVPAPLFPEPDWKGQSGKVQDIIPSLISDPEKTDVFICGAPDLIPEIQKLCIEKIGIPKKNVHAEGF
jgi:ferredoxin-NADP reductase